MGIQKDIGQTATISTKLTHKFSMIGHKTVIVKTVCMTLYSLTLHDGKFGRDFCADFFIINS